MFKKKRGLSIWLLLAVIIFFLLLAFLQILNRELRETIIVVAENRATQVVGLLTDEMVNQTIDDLNLTYEELIKIHKDGDGNIGMIQADTVQINRLTTALSVAVQERLLYLDEESFAIPLGQITDNYFLSHWGPSIPLAITPAGNLQVALSDEFKAAGINQTKHTIHILLKVQIRIAVPLFAEKLEVSREFPLVENIIIGDVPEAVVDLQKIIE